MYSVSSNTSILQSFLLESGFSPEIEERTIANIQSQVDQKINQTRWVVIEEARKTSTYAKGQFLKIAQSCFKLAQCYFFKDIPEKAAYYGKEALSYLHQCCNYPTYPSLDSRNWFLISNLYAFQVKLNPINRAPLDQEFSLIREELTAVNAALSEVYHPQAMLRKGELLQILEARGLPTSESSLACLRSYLDHHPDPMSDDYLEKTSLYFAKRALEEKRIEAPLLELKEPSKESSYLSSEIDNLIRDCETGSLKDQEVRATADLLILKCLRTKDLFLARKGLCSLLKLPIERIQKDVIDCLKPLFRLSYLADDVKENFEFFCSLERTASSSIQSSCQKSTSEHLLVLIDLYTDIVERLWLLLYLKKENTVISIIEQYMPYMLKNAQEWPMLFLKNNETDEKMTHMLTTLRLIFQTMNSYLPVTMAEISQLKLQLSSPILSISVGNIYRGIGGNHRAIKHYLWSLNCLIFRDMKDLTAKRSEADVCHGLGNAYHLLRDYPKAIVYHEKHLKIAHRLNDQREMGKAYGNLGAAYCSLGEYAKAINCHEKDLQIAQTISNSAGKKRAYGNLGCVYQYLGEYRRVIEYQKESLEIAQELKDRAGEGRACVNLGSAYNSMGEYAEAIKYYEKYSKITQKLGDRVGRGGAFINLGNVYNSLGEHARAIDFYKSCLELTQELDNRAGKGQAYAGLGNAYYYLGKYSKAIDYHKKDLASAQELRDRAGEGTAYTNLGNPYYSLGKYSKAINCYEKSLEIAQELKDRAGEGTAYGNLGNGYGSMRKHSEAINCYKKSLEIAQEIGDRESEGEAYSNLGYAYGKLGMLSDSEEHFRKGIDRLFVLQQKLGDNHQWKIAIFERHSKTHIEFERVLLEQNKIDEALKVTDARRYVVLTEALSKKLTSLSHQFLSLTFLTTEEIQALAQRLKTTFVVYSAISNADKAPISVWAIPPQGEVIYRLLPNEDLPEELKSASGLLKQFPYISTRPTRPTRADADFDLGPVRELPTLPFLEEMQELYRGGGGGEPEEKFKERLTQWYTAFITPIQDCLPRDPTQTVTIVPDGFLSQLPFAAFRDQEGKYLIEKYPICMAPSLKALQLLDQLPKEFPSHSIAIGNPTTGNPKDALTLAEQEIKEKVAPILSIPSDRVWTQKAPVVGRVLEEMPKARFIHFACHGLAGDKPEEKLDPHSVFEGLLKLAPDKTRENGYLYAQEIASLSLQAELVFMSACFSGRGKIQREGAIGHNWSFLAAGARSTISTYWRLPESELTLKMVETFYRHLLGKEAEKLNKARALQQAMLMAIEKERENPHKWGAFFLSGLDRISEELTKIPVTHLPFFETSLEGEPISELAQIMLGSLYKLADRTDDTFILEIECILVKLWLLQQKDPSTFKEFVEQMTYFEENERRVLREALDRIRCQREPIVNFFLETYKSKYSQAL